MKPTLQIDTSGAIRRQFSFEAGDDSATISTSPADALPAAVRDRLLRKSVSTSILSDKPLPKGIIGHDRALSPVEQSPTSSAPVSESTMSKRLTRIPTPVFYSGAKPRQERESSASSLLTAIRNYDACYESDSSMDSSSAHSRADRAEVLHGLGSLRSANSNSLLEHTNALRSSALMTTARKGHGSTSVDADLEKQSCLNHGERRRSPPRSNNSRMSSRSRKSPNVVEQRKENSRPMALVSRNGDEGINTAWWS